MRLAGVYFSYRCFHALRGDYAKALDMYRSGVEASYALGNEVHFQNLYLHMAEANEKLGDNHRALAYYRRCQEETVARFGAERERLLSKLKVKYELGRKENEIQRNKLLLQQRRRTQVLALLSAIVLLASAGTICHARKKKPVLSSDRAA